MRYSPAFNFEKLGASLRSSRYFSYLIGLMGPVRNDIMRPVVIVKMHFIICTTTRLSEAKNERI